MLCVTVTGRRAVSVWLAGWVGVCHVRPCIVSKRLEDSCHGMEIGNRTQGFEWYHFNYLK